MRLCMTFHREVITWRRPLFDLVKRVASSFWPEGWCTIHCREALSSATTDLSMQKKHKKLHKMHNIVFKSNLHNSHTYIILIRSRSSVLRTIQLHSHRRPEHPGGSDAEVILVYEGAIQVVCIWCWEGSQSFIGNPGSLLERMKCTQFLKTYLVYWQAISRIYTFRGV